MEEIFRILGELIEEGEAIKNERYEDSKIGWQRSRRWENHCKDLLTKHISMVEAENFERERGSMRMIPAKFLKRGFPDPNFINHVDAKLGFLRALQEDIDKHPEAWKEKLGKTKGVQPMKIEEIKKKRFQYLHRLFEITEGNRYKNIGMFHIGEDLGFNQELIDNITNYLHAEGLIEFHMGPAVSITHEGIIEVEEALSEPEEPTVHFPPAKNIIIIGEMKDSQIQQASPEAKQIVAITEDSYPAIREILKELKESLDKLGLEKQERSDLRAEIQTVEAQMDSSKPKSLIISESFKSILRILETAAATVIGMGLHSKISALLGGG